MTDKTGLKIDDSKPVIVQYLMLPLSEGREVLVGYNKDDKADTGYFFNFKNGDQVTKLRLSREAFAAIIKLKADVDMHRDVGEVYRYTMKVNVSGDGNVEVAQAT